MTPAPVPARTGLAGVLLAGAAAPVLAGCVGVAPPPPPDPGAAAPEPARAPAVSLYLLGDGGHLEPSDPLVLGLRERIRRRADSTRVVVALLGDNVYPRGLRLPGRHRSRDSLRLEAQLSLVRDTRARAVFLPGNHDWGGDDAGARRSLARQARFLERRSGGRAVLAPPPACPGPVVRDEGALLRLVILDTEWWLRDDGPPGPPEACAAGTPGEVVAGLRRALAGGGDRSTVVLGHHPLRSGGHHGGYVSVQEHVFPFRPLVSWLWLPLPGARAVYELYRAVDPSSQDLEAPVYRTLVDSMRAGFRGRPPLLYAAGHDHDLQLHRPRPDASGAPRFHLVSGSASEGKPVRSVERTRFRSSRRGYARLDVTEARRVRLSFHVLDRGGTGATLREVFARWLEPGGG